MASNSGNLDQLQRRTSRKNTSLPGTLGAEKGRTEQRRALLSLFAAAVLWSTSYVVTKIGVGDIPPLTFGAIRFLFAAVLVGLLALFTRQVQRVPVRDILRLAVGGLLGITAYFSLQNLGVQLTSASNATLLVASFPAITMLLEVVLFKKQVLFIRFVGVGVAFVGVYLVIRQAGASVNSHSLQGNLFLLATGLVWAIYNFVTQDVIRKYSIFTVIFWQTLVGAAAFLPLALLEAGAWQPLTLAGLMSALFLGTFCSVAAFLLYGYGLRSLDPGSAVSMMNLVPIFGLILAVIGLKEEVSLSQILGGLIVIGGVMLSVQFKSGQTIVSDESNPKSNTAPTRCIIVVDKDLPVGQSANSAAVIALTVGQRHPVLVGEPLIDASGFAHPGLIPIGIAVLAASQEELSEIRQKGLTVGCDVIDFPREGQKTKDYQTFRNAVAAIQPEFLHYVGVALVGQKKEISKIVGQLKLLQ